MNPTAAMATIAISGLLLAGGLFCEIAIGVNYAGREYGGRAPQVLASLAYAGLAGGTGVAILAVALAILEKRLSKAGP